MKSLFKQIRKIDLFAPRIQLRFHSKKEYKTTFGGCFTILLIIGTTLLALSYFKELILRSNPTLLYREQLWEKGEYSYIGKTSDVLLNQAIGVYDIQNNRMVQNIQITVQLLVNNSIYSFNLSSCQEFNKNYQDLELSVMLFKSQSQNVNFSDLMKSYYCFNEQDISFAKNILINFDIQLMFFIKVPRENNSQYQLRYLQKDYYINTNNYINPFQPYWKVENLLLTKDLISQNVQVSLQLEQIISDIGYVFSDDNIESQILVQNIDVYDINNTNQDSASNNTNSPNFINVSISFQIQRKILINKRSYIKIFDVIAIVGGFIKSLMVCFRFLSKPFTKIALYVSILNELFSFSESEDDDEGLDKEVGTKKNDQSQMSKEEQERETQENIYLNKILNQEIQNENQGNSMSETKENVQLKGESETIFRRFMRIGQNTLIMNLLDYITHIFKCGCNKKKRNLIKQSKYKVNERLDIVYILQKLVEIDKLKMILLNDQQRRVFDYLPKPLVKVQQIARGSRVRAASLYRSKTQHQNIRTEWSLLHSEISPLQKAILAVRAFQNIMKSDSAPLSIIDLKLIEMLDPQIVKKFCAIKLNSISEIGLNLIEDDTVINKTGLNQHLNSFSSLNNNKKINNQNEVKRLNEKQIDHLPLIGDYTNYNNSIKTESYQDKQNKLDEDLNKSIQSPQTLGENIDERASNIGIVKQIKYKNGSKDKLKTLKASQVAGKLEKMEQSRVTQASLINGQLKMTPTTSILKSKYIGLTPLQQQIQQLQMNLSSERQIPIQNSDKVRIVTQYLANRKQIRSLGIETDFYDNQLIQSQNQSYYNNINQSIHHNIIENRRRSLRGYDLVTSHALTNQPHSQRPLNNYKYINDEFTNGIIPSRNNNDLRLNTIKEVQHQQYQECSEKDKSPLTPKQNDLSELSIVESNNNNICHITHNIPSFNNTLNQYQNDEHLDLSAISINNVAQERQSIIKFNPSHIETQFKNNKFSFSFHQIKQLK